MSRRNVSQGPRAAAVAACMAVLCWGGGPLGWAQQPDEGKPYTAEEIAQTEPEVFFQAMARPEEGHHQFAGMWALIEQGRAGDPDRTQAIIDRAIEIMQDPALFIFQRWQCCYVLSGIGDDQAVPALAEALQDPVELLRGVAPTALGAFDTPEAEAALRAAAQREPSAQVRDTIEKALRGEFRQGQAQQAEQAPVVPLDEALSGRVLTVTLVQDVMAIENTGPAADDVELLRYFPVVDDEQAVLARWAEATDQDGQVIPVTLGKVAADQQGNLIHTWSLGHVPAQQTIAVTLSSVVVRHERPAPQGRFPIPAPTDYPPEVRPFLAATPLVTSDHPEVVAESKALLEQTRDALELAQALAEVMRAKPYDQLPNADPALPTAASVLRSGGSCCGSAVAVTAVLRASGIPAQLTYAPKGYLHGIVRFHLQGYGWVRMDGTCGNAQVPLMQKAEDLGLARLFDMPIEMEQITYAYAWPYHHNDATGEYAFRVGGQTRPELRFSNTQCWSRNRVLGGVPWDGTAEDWRALAEASRQAVSGPQLGEFAEVTAFLPAAAAYVEAARDSAP